MFTFIEHECPVSLFGNCTEAASATDHCVPAALILLEDEFVLCFYYTANGAAFFLTVLSPQ